MCKKQISVCLALLVFLLVLFTGCGAENKQTDNTTGTVEDVKYYKIQFPEEKSNDIYYKDLIREMFEMDQTESLNPYSIVIQDFSTKNSSTMVISGFNIAGCDKSVAYAGNNDRDYFVFFDGKIDKSNYQKFLQLMLSNESMPYSDGEKYIKEYLKN